MEGVHETKDKAPVKHLSCVNYRTCMNPNAQLQQQEIDKGKLFRETARVVIIDDRCGTMMDPGDMTRAMCSSWAHSATLFHVRDIEGSTPEEKIEDIRKKLVAAIGTDSRNMIFVLDRDLGIGNLPLSGAARNSVAAIIDKYNDGPALVPHIRRWFNDAPIVGFTGEGDTTGMSEVYSGAPVIQKPEYNKLKQSLIDTFAESLVHKYSLQNETMPPVF